MSVKTNHITAKTQVDINVIFDYKIIIFEQFDCQNDLQVNLK